MDALTEAVDVRYIGMVAYHLAREYQSRCGACGYKGNGKVADYMYNIVYRTCAVCCARNRIVLGQPDRPVDQGCD